MQEFKRCVCCHSTNSIVDHIFPVIIEPGWLEKLKGKKTSETNISVYICHECLKVKKWIILKGKNIMEALDSLYHDHLYMMESVNELV